MIDAHNPVLTAIIYALLLSPLLFLGLAWTSARRNRMNVGKPAQAALVAVTVGYIFLSLSFVFRRALLGGDYSPRLYRTCQFNILLNLGLLGSLFRARGPLVVKVPSGIACALVALAWYYVLVVNSVA